MSQFQDILLEAIVVYDLKVDIADAAQVPPRVVAHWAMGKANPLPSIQEFVLERVRALVDEEKAARKEANAKAIAYMRSINDWE